MSRDDELRLHAYLDGELSATESSDFERRLAGDAELRQGLSDLRAIGERIRSQARYYEAPAGLRERVLRQVRRAEPRSRKLLPFWGSLAGGVACAALAAWLVPSLLPMMPAQQRGWQPSVEEVLDDHLRALLGPNPVDVASSDHHTVKPWLSAHLGFSPAVPDLSQQGFELVGGRLDVLDAKPVAVLVYKRRQHVISVFIWPSEHPGAGPTEQRRGYNMVRWGEAGLSYWAVSDLNARELREFGALLSSD